MQTQKTMRAVSGPMVRPGMPGEAVLRTGVGRYTILQLRLKIAAFKQRNQRSVHSLGSAETP